MTIRWFTDADRAERARIGREMRERDELRWMFVQWLTDRAEHRGPVRVPELSPEMESRLIRLLRERTAPPPPP